MAQTYNQEVRDAMVIQKDGATHSLFFNVHQRRWVVHATVARLESQCCEVAPGFSTAAVERSFHDDGITSSHVRPARRTPGNIKGGGTVAKSNAYKCECVSGWVSLYVSE